ncbi:MAG: sensor histidine kinase [Flavobacterium sp.]
MSTYINELTEYLDSSFIGNCPVKFKLDIDQIDFPLSHSIPIGLIINEAVTNSIKYAFDVCGDCFISILLKKDRDGLYLLKISDNGKGMPDNFEISESNSLGMRLIEGLSNDIHAELKIYNDNGSVIELLFAVPENQNERVPSSPNEK